MRLPFPWRRGKSADSESAAGTKAASDLSLRPVPGEPEVDINQPRECVYRSFEEEPGPCPRCGGPLRQSRQTYMVATRHGRRVADSFMVGSDFGWFCTRCPTVVIDPDDVQAMLQATLPNWDVGEEFAVLGIVDLSAVPNEKKNVPLGDPDNPIPLVEFAHGAGGPSHERPAEPGVPRSAKPSGKALRKARKKARQESRRQ
ncbi:MAG: hypothetical protein HY331_17295 [Chloroflexi bacterium]|nr:hypothetical protein [Chloroflexota bacterium]